MTKLFLPYNKTILKINVIFSSVLALFSSSFIRIISKTFGLEDQDPQSLLHLFLWHYIIWLITGGFLLAAYYFEVARKKEYYFYYNLGLSKVKLILIAYTLHLIIILPLLYILQYV
jgi:hypothetical protein